MSDGGSGIATRFTLAGAACLAAAAAAGADVVRLRNGGVLEGEVRDLGDALGVRSRGGEIRIPHEDVAGVEPAPTVEAQFQRRRAEAEARDRLAPGGLDVEARLALGRWCAERRLRTEAAGEFLAVLRAAPDHAEASRRAAELGYERFGDAWMTRDEAMRRRGYVLHGGRWMTAAEQQGLAAEDGVRKRIASARQKADPGAIEAIRRDLKDTPAPVKLRPALEALRDASKRVRLLGATLLADAGEKGAVPHLVKSAIEDGEPEVRKAARDAARGLDAASAVSLYGRVAAQDQGAGRLRALQALGEFEGNREAAGALIVSYRAVLLDVRATCARLVPPPPRMPSITTPVGPTSVTIETPTVRVESVRTTVMVPDSVRIEREMIVDGLQRVTGQRLGDDLGAWMRWWEAGGGR
jgi:hypothetical protein